MKKKKIKDLTTVDEKNSNKISNVIDPDIEEAVTTVLCGKGGNRRDKYFLFRILGIPPRIAARVCNYNEDYGYKLNRKFREDQNLRTHIEQITGQMPEQYKALCRLRLVDVAEIEGKALSEYKDNPNKAIDKPQLLKQVKQGAGVLADDEINAPRMINIEHANNLMFQIHQDGLKKNPGARD
jgi:hypothetical protein